jgi:LuxR family transcriptional regulator, maltose regulon positive regulatory protein
MSKAQWSSKYNKTKAERIPNDRLKAHRLKKNWTQVYVATMIGTSDVEVSRWETGVSIPTLYFREKLCELFGASPDELGFVSSSDETESGEAAGYPLHRRDSLNALLATKLYVPRPRPHLVPRSHLIERLQQGVERALTLVSAPAGFGKTTLLAQWLAHSHIPVAWLSLEPEDNDATRFLSYVLAALQTLDASLGTTALTLLHSPQPAPVETVLTVLTNELLSRAGEEFVLVLDDYHVITAESLHQGMSFLLEHLPPQLHLIFATRTDPPLPLARLRVQGQLCEIRTAELRFDEAEVSAFLETVMGLHLLPEAMATLQSRTEGWIAGLQLAALSLQGRADVADFLTAFSGNHRFVLDYLSDEVFSRQPASVQSFLLHTSILDRLSGPLCDAVSGQEDEMLSGQAMLEALDKANLFVVPLDDERGWYRYHHLFAEVLRSRLQQAEPMLVPELHQRASLWYEQHELPIEAVQHALAASDFERATRLIEPIALPIALQGHIYMVLDWLKALPEELVHSRPFLCVSYARLLMFTNQLQAAEELLQQAEESIQELPTEQAQTLLGWVLSTYAGIAGMSGDVPHAITLAQQALELLPEKEMIPRQGAIITASRAYEVSGDVTSTTEHEVATVVESLHSTDSLFAAVSSICRLARLHVLQGRLRQAATTYAQVEQAIPQPEVLLGMFTGLDYYFGLGNLLYEWNKLDAAERHLSQGMALVNEMLSVEPYVTTLGYTTMARLKQARGNTRAALAILDALAHLAGKRHFPTLVLTQVSAVRVQLELTQGYLTSAIDWAKSSGLSAKDEDLPYPREVEYLVLARVRIAQGRDDPAAPFLLEALHLLNRLLHDAETKARMGSVLEILVLRALALEAQHDRAGALSTLERTLLFAEPEGYIRIFVDEGAPMATLLRHAYARGIVTSYVTTLLAEFAEGQTMVPEQAIAIQDQPLHSKHSSTKIRASSNKMTAASTSHGLTSREQEVLHLVAQGLSDAQIAEVLVISPRTVNAHLRSIYSKMRVTSRHAAMHYALQHKLV